MATTQNKTIYEVYLNTPPSVSPQADDLVLFAQTDTSTEYSVTYACPLKTLLLADVYEGEDDFWEVFASIYDPECFEKTDTISITINVIWQGLGDEEKEPPVESLEFTVIQELDGKETGTTEPATPTEDTDWTWYSNDDEFPRFSNPDLQTGEYTYELTLESVVPEGFSASISKDSESTDDDIIFNATLTKKKQ